jgi:glycine/D-amino acid oxidase-like deaminating enzyme
MPSIAVIGAGLQGCCAALALARRGADVHLYDKEPALLTGASRWNEGKIHLGYIYANDRGDGTLERLLDGAASFAPLLREQAGLEPEALQISQPFTYLVKRDSQLPAEAVATHFARVDAAIARRREAGFDYLGRSAGPASCAVNAPDIAGTYDARQVAAAFRTSEYALRPETLCAAVAAAVEASPRIRTHLGVRIDAIEEAGDRLRLRDEDGGSEGPFDDVVNAAWEDRLRLDASLGRTPDKPWLHRYKLAIHVRGAPAAEGLPTSTTMMLGEFGDIVRFSGGDWYLSWYPACRLGQSGALAPPDFLGGLQDADCDRVRRTSLEALAAVAPGLADLDLDSATVDIAGGHIFTWGATGIRDMGSEVHSRVDIGVETHGRVHSIDTGKLGMAPLFAEEAARRIMEGKA